MDDPAAAARQPTASTAERAAAPSASPGQRSWLPRVLFESFLIVLSVLLALGLDEWRQNRAQDERVALALAGIRSELETNRDAVMNAATRHIELRDTLATFAAADRPPPPAIYYNRGMFNPARVLSTAWESARATAALDRLPYGLVLQLSQVYSDGADYTGLRDRIVADIMVDIRRTSAEEVLRDDYRGFIVLAEDFSNREMRLRERYDRVLAQLDSVAASEGTAGR